jgi:predicted amidohydrolase YtcJ
MSRILPRLLLLLLLPAPAFPANLILTNATVYRGDGAARVTSVAVSGDRIVYVGDEPGLPELAGARRIDLRGALLTAGLVDAHVHMLNLGRSSLEVQLLGAESPAAAAARVRVRLAEAPEGEWVHGRGWDQNLWTQTSFPTWRDLAGMDSHPVYLDRVDGHATWVNRRAMTLCGITRDTPDPPGGEIIRDAQGEPTGVFIDNAEFLITRKVPPFTAEQIEARLERAIAACNAVGLTGVHDAGIEPAEIAAYRRIGERGALTLNIYGMVDSEDPEAMRSALRAGPQRAFDGRLIVRSVKLRADGALGSRGAALLAPYDDRPGEMGLLVTPADTLRVWATEAMRAGFQPATHAIGDRGNRVTLDAYQAALKETAVTDARPRIEHVQILSLDDVPRFAALGVIASMQPTHATSDMPWAAQRIGAGRLAGGYVWRRLLNANAVLAFGSDAPVESVDPLWGLYAAVTRQDHAGKPAGGWMPDQRVTMAEAIDGFIRGAAFAAFDEDDAGTVAVGKRADLTVIDRNLFQVAPAESLDARIRMTIVRGEVVYERED